MKKYCKNIDITDVSLIMEAVHNFIKHNPKRAVFEYISEVTGLTSYEIRIAVRLKDSPRYKSILHTVAKHLSRKLKAQLLDVAPIEYSERWDVHRQKMRIIGKQVPESCILDHLLVLSLRPFFKRIGDFQVASMPKKGQLYGAKKIARWIKDPKIRYFVKMDIKKCYEHILPEKILNFVRTYVNNKGILYLLSSLLSRHEYGLSIGSYISQWLCNVYLAQAYHFITERFSSTRRGKRIRTVKHALFYMDDIVLIGTNERTLTKAALAFQQYLSEELGLTVKPWVCRDLNQQCHGRPAYIDMMGYRIHRGFITIRSRIFIRALHKIRQLSKQKASYNSVSLQSARSFASYYGFIKNSANTQIYKKYGVKALMKACVDKVSAMERKRTRERALRAGYFIP